MTPKKPISYNPEYKKQIMNSYKGDPLVQRMKPNEVFQDDDSPNYSIIVHKDGSYDIFPKHHAAYIRSLINPDTVDRVFGGTYMAMYSLWENSVRMFVEGNGCSITFYGIPTKEQINTIASIINGRGLYWYVEFEFENYERDERGSGPDEFIEAVNRNINPNEVSKEKQEKLKTLRYFRDNSDNNDYNTKQASVMLKKAQKYDDNQEYEKADRILDWIIRKPGEAEIPEGRVRRFHYTDEENLESIKQHGIRLDKSKSWKQGDPKAVWSSPKIISHKPTIEFHTDPKTLISDTYQFGDVPVEDIIAIHEPWHEQYYYIKHELESGRWTMQDLHDRMKEIPEEEYFKDYWTAYRQILKEAE